MTQPDVKGAFEYAENRGVATITFNRPDRLNALTFEVYGALHDLTADLKQRDDVRVLVIRGQGRGFSSGGDVDEIIGALVGMGTRQVYEFARATGACVRNIREMPQPVIAAVNGIAAGAGAMIALSADLRICSDRARFDFLFTKVGLSGGDMGACWLLPRVVGMGRATEILMLGDSIDAWRAQEIGLATSVVRHDALEETVNDWAARLQERAPWGLAMTKEMLNRAASMDYASAIEMEAWTQSLLMTAEDFKEYRASFAEGRSPTYRGG